MKITASPVPGVKYRLILEKTLENGQVIRGDHSFTKEELCSANLPVSAMLNDTLESLWVGVEYYEPPYDVQVD